MCRKLQNCIFINSRILFCFQEHDQLLSDWVGPGWVLKLQYLKHGAVKIIVIVIPHICNGSPYNVEGSPWRSPLAIILLAGSPWWNQVDGHNAL